MRRFTPAGFSLMATSLASYKSVIVSAHLPQLPPHAVHAGLFISPKGHLDLRRVLINLLVLMQESDVHFAARRRTLEAHTRVSA